MPSIDLPLGQVFIRDLNPEGGDPVVMIHGLLTNHTVFATCGALQLATTRRVTMYDLRGHGLTEIEGNDFRLTTIAQDLFSLMDALGIARADLVGYSFGAATAIQALLLAPERIGRLALIEPYGLSRGQLPTRDTTVDEGVADYARSTSVAVGERRVTQLREQLSLLYDHYGLVESLDADADFFIRAPLDHLTSPVLVLSGKSSVYRGDAETLARRLPKASLHVTRGDHNLPVTRSRWVARWLTRWGKEVSGGHQRT